MLLHSGSIRAFIEFVFAPHFVLSLNLYLHHMVEVPEVFSLGGVPDQFARYFHHTCKLETLDHFLNYVVHKDFEAELKVRVAKTFPVKDEFTIEEHRLHVSKASSAYQVDVETGAAFTQARSSRESDQVETNWENLPSSQDVKALKEAWSQLHNWKLCKSMKPLKNRIFREFKAHAVTLHTVDKAVTIEDTNRPEEATRVPIGSGVAGDALYFETAKPMRRTTRTRLEYISALRLLTGTYAYSGMYCVDSKVVQCTQVILFLGRWRWDVLTKSWNGGTYRHARVRDETTRETWPSSSMRAALGRRASERKRVSFVLHKTDAHTSQEPVQEPQHRDVKREHHARENESSRWPVKSQSSANSLQATHWKEFVGSPQKA